tara:strand:- start:270 stop:1019 length:750 start_codon:yes stop_codon:yes gene_type:complete
MIKNPQLSKSLTEDLIMANRILVKQGVLDVFGHISVRDPEHSAIFWLPTSVAPSRVSPVHLHPFNLEAEPVINTEAELFSERFIHSEIYRRVPDVNAICHHHSHSIMPFCITGAKLFAVSQTGAFLAEEVPHWDSQDEHGDTMLLIDDQKKAQSLAGVMDGTSAVLLRGHGMVQTGNRLQDLVHRCVFACREAETILSSLSLCSAKPLFPGEIEAIGAPSPIATSRSWSHWTKQVNAKSQEQTELGRDL